MGGTSFDARMAVIRLRSGELILHSPCDITPAIAEQIHALGPVGHIVAPGNFHTMYVSSAQAAFPNAKTWICPGSERRRPGLKYDAILGDVPPQAWAGEIEQVLVQGTRFMREVALFHRASRTLILVDLIENFTDATPHTSFGLRIWFKLIRMWNNPRPAPEYRMGWSNRTAAADSLRRILSWDFEKIIVGHGDNIETDAKATARRAWRALVQ